jgi:hypothetical protein
VELQLVSGLEFVGASRCAMSGAGSPPGSGRVLALRVALAIVGAVALLGVYPLMRWWPAGFRWQPAQPEYDQMIVAIYATLGVFLLRAARQPLRHLSLIWFAVWSSVAHAAVMMVHAWRSPEERVHLVGDIALLWIVAVVLGGLTWSATRGSGAPPSGA